MTPRTNRISVRWKLLLVVLLVQLPFCMLFLYNSNRTVERVNNQLAESQKSALDIFRESLEDQIKNAEEYLYVQCWGAEEVLQASGAQTAEEGYAALESLMGRAKLLLETNANLETVTFSVPSAEACWSVDRTGAREDTRPNALLQTMIAQDQVINRGWSLQNPENKDLFVRVCEYQGVYVSVAMNLDEIATNARVYSSLNASVVVRKGSRILNEAVWTRGLNGTMPSSVQNGDGWYFIDNPVNGTRYQVVETNFAGMTLCMGTRYQYDWTWMHLQGFALAGVFVLTLLIGILYLNKTFFYPLNDLVSVMESIGRGEHPSLELPNQGREFTRISTIFQGMLNTLEEQKIAAYENQIKAQRMETNALRLQIRRHFFLNCLKNIYAMANAGDIDSIKKIVLLLSVNLRYTLDLHKDAVDLEWELKMCRNYVELQGVGQNRPPVLHTKVDPELMHFLIPPVSILTMLENCCKYGSRQDAALEITISAQRRVMDDQEFVWIAIQDNGMGFRQEDLHNLNNNLSQVQAEGHVGVSNTIARIRMMYGENCEVLFSNRSGARVEWIIPVPAKKEKKA